ncbi:MAG: hypothetical protein ACXABY_05655 [Candidatus Thorarchaeota archaeon]|jgi:hypothetical protein
MAPQGAENDLKDVRFYDNTSKVETAEDNEPVIDINDNVLTIDNKAILAKTLANDAAAQLLTHIGGSGATQHPDSTDTVSGFISVSDKVKLNGIAVEAKINILAPVDALELVSGRRTTLHTHIPVSVTTDGLMSAADKVKLNGIATGANVNFPDLADADALARDPGGDANSLHVHTVPTLFETFRETGTDGVPPGATYHSNVDHLGLPGVPAAFTGFVNKAPYNGSPTIGGIGTNIFVNSYFSFTTLQVVTAGLALIQSHGGAHNWDFNIYDISISGLDGIVTFGSATHPAISVKCWQGGFGE